MTIRALVFDLETTSQHPAEARIVTAYLGILEPDGTISNEQSWLVNPGVPIPPETTAIHGITDEKAQAEGWRPDLAVHHILSIIGAECSSGGLPLAGANISYDLTVLDREIRRHGRVAAFQNGGLAAAGIEFGPQGVTVLDSLVIDKAIDKYRKGSRRLVDMAEHYGVPITAEEAHEARADAVAAGRIIQKELLRPGARGLPLEELHSRQIRWKKEQAASLQAYFRGKGGKPDAVVDGSWPLQPYNPETEAIPTPEGAAA